MLLHGERLLRPDAARTALMRLSAICLVHIPPNLRPTTWLKRGADAVHTRVQLHAIVLALCASLIAPFGGFFASGFKRSFKVKDFGNSIPGHGGMTDRMDCQASHPSDSWNQHPLAGRLSHAPA